MRARYASQSGVALAHPNPIVGAVIVKNGQVSARDFTITTIAITPKSLPETAGDKARGATLYVTLEPCCHTGRTGPCTKAIIDAGIVRVVAAMLDPNPPWPERASRNSAREFKSSAASRRGSAASQRGFRALDSHRLPSSR